MNHAATLTTRLTILVATGVSSCGGSVAGGGGSEEAEGELPMGGGGAAEAGGGSTQAVPAATVGATPAPDAVLDPWTWYGFDACPYTSQVPQPYDPMLMVVVDVSGSMTQPAPGANMTKWEATRYALSQLVQDLPSSVAMGIVYYPNMDPLPLPHTEPAVDPSECVNTDALVAPQRLDDAQRSVLQDSLMDVYPGGGTPTHTAYTVGVQALEAAGERLSGNQYVLLITDGEPTYGAGCVGNGTTLGANIDPAYIADTLSAIGQAADPAATLSPIETFVIGSPGSELDHSGKDARPWLSEAAALGGTAPVGCSNTGPDYCHFDLTDPNATFASGLTNALAQVVEQVVGCDYAKPDAPDGGELDWYTVDLKFSAGDETEYRVPLVNRADCGDDGHGWFWRHDWSLSLCPATCSMLRADASASIEIAFGCTVRPF